MTPLRPKPRHDRRPRVPAHRLRVRTSPPNRSNCPRWRASEHCSTRLLTRIPKQVRATLGDARWADFVALANACYEDAFLSAFPKPVLRCVGLPNGGTCPHNFCVDLTCARAGACYEDAFLSAFR